MSYCSFNWLVITNSAERGSQSKDALFQTNRWVNEWSAVFKLWFSCKISFKSFEDCLQEKLFRIVCVNQCDYLFVHVSRSCLNCRQLKFWYPKLSIEMSKITKALHVSLHQSFFHYYCMYTNCILTTSSSNVIVSVIRVSIWWFSSFSMIIVILLW